MWKPPATAPRSTPVPSFTHVVLVVFENHEASEIAGSSAAPAFNALGRRYARLTRYDAVTHPSLPNYLALVSGSTHGIRSDCVDCLVNGRSLADTLTSAGKTWKTYAEGLPSPGFEAAPPAAMRESTTRSSTSGMSPARGPGATASCR